MMRILHVTPTYLPAVRYGGPIYSVHGLCRSLVENGHEVHVFTTSVDGKGNSDVVLGQAVNLEGVRVWYFPSQRLRRLYYSRSMMTMLQKHVREFDLVHLHSVFLWPTWGAARVARKIGVPYILSPRGMLVKDLIRRKSWFLKSCWIQMIEKKNIAEAAAIHLTSQIEENEFLQLSFKSKKQQVIANGVCDFADWSNKELTNDVRAVANRGDYVLFFGRLNWKKGLDRLIRCWKEVQCQLIIAGNDEEGYLTELKSLAGRHGVENRITFLPRSITGADKEALFSSAKVFVLPSYSENFGITVLEAMMRSVPVVVTHEVGAASIVNESGSGIITDGDYLGGSINEMLQDKKKMQIMGNNGRQWAAHRYSWDTISLQMADLYQSVIST